MYDLTPKNADGMNIRADHRVDSKKIDDLYIGEHVKGDLIYEVKVDGEAKDAKVGDKWLRLTSEVGWIAIVHNGELLSEVTEVGEPPKGEFPLKFRLTNLETGESAEYERKAL